METPGQLSVEINSRFKNCHGRAVKMVSEFGSVTDIQIVRNGEIYSGFKPGSSEDIDFQVAGGTVRNIKCYYNDNCPQSVVTFNVTVNSGRRNNTQCLVDDVTVSMFGASTPNRLVDVYFSVAPTNPGSIKVVVQNVQVGGISSNLDDIVRLNNEANVASGPYYMISLINVSARILNAMIWRNHASIALQVLASGFAVENMRPANVPLASGTLTTNITNTLAGTNQRVTV